MFDLIQYLMQEAKTVNHIFFVIDAGFVIIQKLYLWKINFKNKIFQQEEIMNIYNGKPKATDLFRKNNIWRGNGTTLICEVIPFEINNENDFSLFFVFVQILMAFHAVQCRLKGRLAIWGHGFEPSTDLTFYLFF